MGPATLHLEATVYCTMPPTQAKRANQKTTFAFPSFFIFSLWVNHTGPGWYDITYVQYRQSMHIKYYQIINRHNAAVALDYS